jgi:hypothetical protein
MTEALQETGLADRSPGRSTPAVTASVSLTWLICRRRRGFRDAGVQTVELDATWPTTEAATSTLLGPPFGPLVSALSADAQQQARARLASKPGDSADGVTVRTVSNLARGTK